MNTRVIIIMVALAAPIATLAFMTNQAEVLPKPRENPENNAAKAKMSHDPASQPPAMRPGPRPPANIEEAKQRLRMKLAELEKMTPEEWAYQQRRKMDEAMNIRPPASSRRPWDSMTPEQKAAIEANQKTPATDAARAPEVVPQEALPEKELPASPQKP